MKEFKIVNSGNNPKILKFDFMENSRFKSKASISSIEDMVVDGKVFANDLPQISIYSDNFVTNVNNDVATISRNFYDMDVDGLNLLPVIQADAIKNDIKKIINVTEIVKIDNLGKILDVQFENVDTKNEKSTLFVNSLKKAINARSIIFPFEPVGPGAIWFLMEYGNKLETIECDLFSIVHFVERLGPNVHFDVITKMKLSEGKNKCLESVEYINFSGSSQSTIKYNLNSSGVELTTDNVIKSTSKVLDGPDMGKIIEMTSKTFIASEYAY